MQRVLNRLPMVLKCSKIQTRKALKTTTTKRQVDVLVMCCIGVVQPDKKPILTFMCNYSQQCDSISDMTIR